MPLPFLAGLLTKKVVGKALLTGAVSAIGRRSANRSAARQAETTYQRNRADYLADRDDQRIYDTKMRDESRAYNESQSDKAFNRLNDLKAMRQRVEAAGLNFSSYIKGGGGISGGGTPFETPSQGASISAPTMASASIKQSAGGAFVNTFFNSMQDNGLQEERDRLEVEIMREELKGMQRDGEALTKKNWGYSIPEAVTTTRVVNGVDEVPVGDDGSIDHLANETDIPSFRFMGRDLIGSGAHSKAATTEDAVGDIASIPANVSSLWDMWRHTSKLENLRMQKFNEGVPSWWKFAPDKSKRPQLSSRRKTKTPTNYGNVNYPRWPEHNLTHRRGWLFQ